MMKEHFDWKLFLKQVAAIAIPVALQNLLTTTASMVDTMMIGTLGQLNVAAVGLCAQFTSLMFSGYWGFVGGGMLFFAQYWGAKDDDGINRSWGITITFLMTVGLLFGAAGFFFPQLVMSLYTDKSSIQQIGVEYLHIVSLSYPLVVYSVGMASLLRTTDKVRIPLLASICSVTTNLVLNWLLIGGNLGMPALGVRGAAIATVIAQAVNVTVILVLAKHSGHPYLFMISKHFHWNRSALSIYFRKCAPILANEMMMGIGMMVINIVLGRQSENAIAATAVFRTLEGLMIGFFAGFSNAASVLVGQKVGAGDLETAWRRAIRIVYLCQGIIACTALVLLCVHTPLLHLMSLHDESFDLCTGMLIIFGIAAVIRMGNWTQNDTYRSAGDATFGTLLEIIFMFVMVLPVVWLSGMVWHAPFLVVFALIYCDEPIRYVLMQIHLWRGTWIKPVTPQGQAALPAFRAQHGIRSRKAISSN